ncbi:MAG: tetratricopeptide repeat protein [Microcystis sp. LE19-12.2C]|nr:tetratricopeptide repeat protein [Microcystis sp. LE19-12.2C]
MTSETNSNEINLSATAQAQSKVNLIGKIETKNLILSEELLNRLETPSGGIFKGGNARKSLVHWQGREEEITQIKQWFNDQNVAMIGIKGVGGIGKSTLASKIFEEEIPLDPSLGDDEDLFPKRFWWEAGNLGGFSGLARQFLTEFGYPVPKEEIDLQEALIRQLQRHRHLIIIDNLESLLGEDGSWNNEFYQQFFTAWIEKGDTSKIIVTTREKPKTRGFNRWIELKGLKPPEGAQLLAESQITGDLENFSRRVGGHPLLLRLVADLLLAEFPQNPSLERLADLGLGNLSQLLSDPQVVGSHRQETVGIALVLDASFQRLSQRQQELFTKTSIYRREFDSLAAKAVMDNYPEIELSEITADLRELQRRSLLEEKEENRQRIFSFQPLVWEYAQYKAGDQRELHQKAIAYYLSIAQPDSWEILNDVQPYLEIFYHCYQLTEYDNAFDILRAIDDFLTRRGYYQTLADYYLELVTVYQQQEEQTNRKYTASLTSLGNAYDSLGEYQKAIEFHQQSLAIKREIGDRRGEAASYNNLGAVYYSLGEYQKAIEFYQQSLAITREIGDRGSEAKAWFNLGLTYYKLKRISEAKEAYLQSRELFQALGLAGYVQKCDDEIRQLETRKYPLIVAFFLGVVMFPLVLIGGIIVALWRLLKRWLRKA